MCSCHVVPGARGAVLALDKPQYSLWKRQHKGHKSPGALDRHETATTRRTP